MTSASLPARPSMTFSDFWEDVAAVTSAGLGVSLADVQSVADAAVAPNTLTRYKSVFSAFSSFADLAGRCSMPASPSVVASWLVSLVHKGWAPASIRSAAAALSWEHRRRDENDPTEHKTVVLVLKGAQRVNARPIVHKEPLDLPRLSALLSHLLKIDSMPGLRLAALLSLSFAAFLRLSDAISLQVYDVAVSHSHVSVSLRSNKTDPERLGSTRIAAAAPDSSVCPVRILRLYASRLGITFESGEHVFDVRPLWPNFTAHGVPLWGRGPVRPDNIRKQFKLLCAELGPSFESLTFHSCRAGAASAVANDDIDVLALKRLGGWSSFACSTYVDLKTPALLDQAKRVWSLSRSERAPSCDESAPQSADFSPSVSVASHPASLRSKRRRRASSSSPLPVHQRRRIQRSSVLHRPVVDEDVEVDELFIS